MLNFTGILHLDFTNWHHESRQDLVLVKPQHPLLRTLWDEPVTLRPGFWSMFLWVKLDFLVFGCWMMLGFCCFFLNYLLLQRWGYCWSWSCVSFFSWVGGWFHFNFEAKIAWDMYIYIFIYICCYIHVCYMIIFLLCGHQALCIVCVCKISIFWFCVVETIPEECRKPHSEGKNTPVQNPVDLDVTTVSIVL